MYAIGQIEGKDAAPSDFYKFFSDNDWDTKDMDYYRRDDRGLKIGDTNRPPEGTPVSGYRVFTYLEGQEDILGSPVAGFNGNSNTMFGVPQRRYDVNKHPEDKGFYYFLTKGPAVAYAQHLLEQEEMSESDTLADAPLHLIVSRVEGSYVDKYKDGTARHSIYGERMDEMKLVGTPVIDMNINKMRRYIYDALPEADNHFFSRGTGVFGLLNPPSSLRFVEKHPAAMISLKGWQNTDPHKDFNNLDISKYEDLWSPNESTQKKAVKEFFQELDSLAAIYPSHENMLLNERIRRLRPGDKPNVPKDSQLGESMAARYYDM